MILFLKKDNDDYIVNCMIDYNILNILFYNFTITSDLIIINNMDDLIKYIRNKKFKSNTKFDKRIRLYKENVKNYEYDKVLCYYFNNGFNIELIIEE